VTAGLVGRLGYDVERVLADAGARTVLIASRGGSRALVTVVPGNVVEVSRPGREDWDLPLLRIDVVEAADGTSTVIAEDLGAGVPATDRDLPRHAVPASLELLDRMAEAHRSGDVVGRLEPALVFVGPLTGALAGVTQRPLRADANAAKGEGASSLFGTGFVTPAEVRGEAATPDDDRFAAAALIWRLRHGREPMASLSFQDRLSWLGGFLPPDDPRLAADPGLAGLTDALDNLLGRALGTVPGARPSLADLRLALEAAEAAW
jgi:hypothetical protein